MHEPLADFPVFLHRIVHSVSLEDKLVMSQCKPIPTGRERTAISSRYRLSFLATSYASLLRVIGTRSFFHPRVDIYCLS